MAKLIGRSVHRKLYSSLSKAKPNWDVVVPSQKHRKFVDIVVKTSEYNVLVKVKTTTKDYFKLSMFKTDQLSSLNKHHLRAQENLSLVFFYFAKERKLISVDIGTLLNVKLNKYTLDDMQSMGYSILSWDKFDKYLSIMLGFKQEVRYKVKKYKKGRCMHEWIVESCDEAFRRSSSMKYSMGYCRICGRVRNDFENFLAPNPSFSKVS